MSVLIDLIGQRFGKLVVQSRSSSSLRSVGVWCCVCDCGGFIEAYSYLLRKGRTVDCGCSREARKGTSKGIGLIDLVGYKFGLLTVQKYSHTKKGRAYWLCSCDCGNSFTVRGVSLRQGDTKSCGCLRVGRKRKAAKPIKVNQDSVASLLIVSLLSQDN